MAYAPANRAMYNGRPPVKDWMGGGENLRTKDMAVPHQGPETRAS